MEERKNTGNEMTEIFRLLVDFNAFENYRDENGMPLLSMVRFYSLSGIEDAVRKYGKAISPIDNLYANFGTVQRIREIIKDGWSHFNITIKEDCHPEWKAGKSHERRKSAYKLNSKISNSINYDFGEYTPNIDDSLEDGVISFRIFEGNGNDE
mgnify:FL=1